MPPLVVATPEKFRATVCGRIRVMLQPETRVTNLEKAIFNYAIQEATKCKVVKKWENPVFVQLYVDRLRSVLANLPDMIPQIESGEVLVQTVAFMTHQELKPDRWARLIDQKMKRSLPGTETVEASTDMYTCKKCKSKRCTYYEMQTRSADEPATVFITCLDCGKRWRN